jgi:hypothetical protein
MTSLHTPAAALEAARNHYAAALAAHDHLQHLYDVAHEAGRPVDTRAVAAAHDAIRFGFKAGDLAASIAIASDLVSIDTAAAAVTRARLAASTAGRTSDRVRMAVAGGEA